MDGNEVKVLMDPFCSIQIWLDFIMTVCRDHILFNLANPNVTKYRVDWYTDTDIGISLLALTVGTNRRRQNRKKSSKACFGSK